MATMTAAMRPRAQRSGKLFQFLLKYLCLMYLSVDSVPYNEQEMYQAQHTANQQAAALRLIARICRKMKARRAASKKIQVEPKATSEGKLVLDITDVAKDATTRIGELAVHKDSGGSLNTAEKVKNNTAPLPPRAEFESEAAYEAACTRIKTLEKDNVKLENEDIGPENETPRKMSPPPDPLVSGVMTVAGIPRECRDLKNQHCPEQNPDNSNQKHEIYLYFDSKGTESEGKRREAEERTRKLVEQRRSLVK